MGILKKSELLSIPGIGKSIALDLNQLGIYKVRDLKNQDPEKLYEGFEDLVGSHVDRCLLYTFRAAVYFASNQKYDPEKLKWWNYTDLDLCKHRKTPRN